MCGQWFIAIREILRRRDDYVPALRYLVYVWEARKSVEGRVESERSCGGILNLYKDNLRVVTRSERVRQDVDIHTCWGRLLVSIGSFLRAVIRIGQASVHQSILCRIRIWLAPKSYKLAEMLLGSSSYIWKKIFRIVALYETWFWGMHF